jgi:hypothetical protein
VPAVLEAKSDLTSVRAVDYSPLRIKVVIDAKSSGVLPVYLAGRGRGKLLTMQSVTGQSNPCLVGCATHAQALHTPRL